MNNIHAIASRLDRSHTKDILEKKGRKEAKIEPLESCCIERYYFRTKSVIKKKKMKNKMSHNQINVSVKNQN